MKKILILTIISLFLFSCATLESFTKNSKTKNDDMFFDSSKLKYTYFTYVNLPKLASVQNLNNEAISYLVEQLYGKETEFRLLVEKKEIINDNIKNSICDGLDDFLCDLNYHIYAGTKFGFNIYKESSKESKSEETLLAPLVFWSVKWINDSKEEAINTVKSCKNGDKKCINNNITNPISNVYASCYLQYGENVNNNTNFKSCIENYFDTTVAKDYFFIIGYLVGYNISYGLNNS